MNTAEMTAKIAAGDGFIAISAVKLFRDIFQMVDKGKGVGLADLVLDGIEQAEHQLGDRTHGRADIADHHNFRLEGAVEVLQLQRHATVFQVGAQCAFDVQLAVARAFQA